MTTAYVLEVALKLAGKFTPVNNKYCKETSFKKLTEKQAKWMRDAMYKHAGIDQHKIIRISTEEENKAHTKEMHETFDIVCGGYRVRINFGDELEVSKL